MQEHIKTLFALAVNFGDMGKWDLQDKLTSAVTALNHDINNLQDRLSAAENGLIESGKSFVRLQELYQRTVDERDQLRAQVDAANGQQPVGWSLIFHGSKKPNMMTSFDSKLRAEQYAFNCSQPDDLVPNPAPAPIVVPVYAEPIPQQSVEISGGGDDAADELRNIVTSLEYNTFEAIKPQFEEFIDKLRHKPSPNKADVPEGYVAIKANDVRWLLGTFGDFSVHESKSGWRSRLRDALLEPLPPLKDE